jgi:RNA polymerase sigma-70 factor, ECF subfamily
MPPSNPTEQNRAADAALVERYRRREPDAFEELYRLHAPRIFSLACRLTGSTTEGEDLLQEAFVLVFRKLDSFKGDAALGTWIYRLATNCCLDYLRSRQRRFQSASDPLDETIEMGPPVGTRRLNHVDRLDLERAVAELPPGYRAAFVLHDVEGYGHAEVAQMLGIAEGTSKSQVHKARMRMRALLAPAAVHR